MSGTALALTRGAADAQEFLRAQHRELATACAGSITPERLLQVATICLYRTPRIAECDKGSILAAIIQAASLGLDLSPGQGEAYLIPRRNKHTGTYECQFQPGFKGLAKLAKEADPEIVFIQPRLVHHKDKFRYGYNPDLWIEHEPNTEANPGLITHAYAVTQFRTGHRLIEVMTREEIEAIRLRSERPDVGPWREQYGEMARKTVLKRHCKSLKQSPGLAAAIEADNREYAELEDADVRPRLTAPDNQSGHATGRYASPEQTEAWRQRLEAYVGKRNAAWLDRWTDELTGEIPAAVRELCNIWQADNHLLKWCRETGRLDPASGREEGQTNRQICRFTAIVLNRSRADEVALTKELARYIDELERRQTELIRSKHPELFGELDGDSDELQAMADDDPPGEAS